MYVYTHYNVLNNLIEDNAIYSTSIAINTEINTVVLFGSFSVFGFTNG